MLLCLTGMEGRMSCLCVYVHLCAKQCDVGRVKCRLNVTRACGQLSTITHHYDKNNTDDDAVPFQLAPAGMAIR